MWKDYPPDLVWYEPALNVSSELVAEYETLVAAEAAADEAEALEEAELAVLEEEEAMPAP